MTNPAANVPLPPAVSVLGLGLIGGSLLRAAALHLPTDGWSPSEQTRAAAAADGYRVSATLDEAIERSAENNALIVLAAPVTAFDGLLRRIDAVAPHSRLTDVGSVKVAVADQVAGLCPSARYIGSHPMTGTQYSGWPAGSGGLFEGAAWVTCLDEDSDIEIWAEIAGLALTVGSRVVPADAPSHDAAVARISHLPHLLALALAQVADGGGALTAALAASSFADGTRVAGTRPELIRAMCEANRDALIDALNDVLGILGVARGSLASTGSLVKITETGYAANQRFRVHSSQLTDIELHADDDLVEQLLSVGLAGGHVVGLDNSGDHLLVRALYPAED